MLNCASLNPPAELKIKKKRKLGVRSKVLSYWRIGRAVGGAVGASRAVVDAGFIPYDYKLGKLVSCIPKLYIACGISGLFSIWRACATVKLSLQS
jgi:electron transfer flavoprotein alpha subunit